MPSFDPSVISQIPDYAGDPAAAQVRGFKLADLVNTEQLDQLYLNEEKRKAKDADEVRNILQGKDLTKPEGMTEAASALSKSGHPEQAMKLMSTAQEYQTGAAKLAKEKADADLAKLKSYKEKMDTVANVFDEVRAPLDAMKKSGKFTPEQIDLATVQAVTPALKKLAQDMPDVAPQVQQYLSSRDHMTYAGFARAEEETNKGQQRFENEIKKREIAVREREVTVKEKAAVSGQTLSPEAQRLKDDLAAKDPSFMASRSGAKSIQQQNQILEDWAKQGRTADDIIGSRQATKGTGAEVTALEKQKAGIVRIEKSIVAPGGFLDQAESAVKEVDLNKVKSLGKLSNWSKEQLTDPALQNYYTRITELRAEYSIVLAKGGQVTNEARNEAEKVIPDYMTPASFARIKEAIKQGVSASIKAIDESIGEATNKTSAAPSKVLKFDAQGNPVP